MDDDLIAEIVALEWDEFQKVNSEGGRTSCQENWKDFRIYRSSQFAALNQELLESYHLDLVTAIGSKRNLLTEKYARMMESTAPEKFQVIRKALPPVSRRKSELIEQIMRKSILWAEEFAAEYPLISRNGRPVHAYDDTPYATSFETYQRGELATYSTRTLELYLAYVKQLHEEDRNLMQMIMENTVREYGYDSLDHAEICLSRQE